MAHWPLRFIHAGDFHLEQPLGGIVEVPDHLRDALLEAPYRAAQKVFDAVLEHDAHFLVLSGDLIDPQLAGPRGLVFLSEQFERLAVAGKNVYWAAGEIDSPAEWPGPLRLPPNVRVFSPARPEEFVETHDGRPICHVTGQSFPRGRVGGTVETQRDDAKRATGRGLSRSRKIRAADFWPDKNGLFSVGVAYGDAEPAELASRSIHYWALGSAHAASTPLTGACVAHYCGTTQGRHPEETGPHGCTLLTHEPDGRLTLTPLAVDSLRWTAERVHVDDSTSRPELERLLVERMQELSAGHPGVGLLVSWQVTGTGPLAAAMRRGQLGGELLARLRSDFGYRPTPLWSVALEFEPAGDLPEAWYEQETILGDFLRLVRARQASATGDPIDLENYLQRQQSIGSWTQAADPDAVAASIRVLRQAALLGADLLGGQEFQG